MPWDHDNDKKDLRNYILTSSMKTNEHGLPEDISTYHLYYGESVGIVGLQFPLIVAVGFVI